MWRKSLLKSVMQQYDVYKFKMATIYVKNMFIKFFINKFRNSLQ